MDTEKIKKNNRLKAKKMKTDFVRVISLITFSLFAGCISFGAYGQPTVPWTGKGLKFTATGELDITPSPTSSKDDFDYLVGTWKLNDKRLKTRLNNSTEWIEYESTVEMHKLLNGIGNMDVYRTNFGGKPYEGVALRLFNPKTRLWSIYWADGNTGTMDPPMVGSFDGNIGIFYCKDTFNGKPVIVLFHWDKTDKDNPVWSQAFSPDNGKTWEWNQTNVSHRVR
jgi:hypothetical protein